MRGVDRTTGAERAPRLCADRSADAVRVPVDLPLERRVQVEIAVLQEDALLGVDPAGVAVGLLLLHRPHAGVEEGVEVRGLVAALGRGLGLGQRPPADGAEAGLVVAVTVHDDGVVVRELAQDPDAVRLALLDRRVEVHPVALVVLRGLERGVLGRGPPGALEGRAEARVRVAAVDLLQRGEVLGERVARLPVGVQLHQVQHVAGARAEPDDAGGVTAAVSYVLDVLVLGLPVQRGVLGAGDQFHGDLLLRRVVEPGRGDRALHAVGRAVPGVLLHAAQTHVVRRGVGRVRGGRYGHQGQPEHGARDDPLAASSGGAVGGVHRSSKGSFKRRCSVRKLSYQLPRRPYTPWGERS